VQIGVQINTPAEALTCKASVKDADFAVISTEKLSALLDGTDTADGGYESTIKKEALFMLLSDIAKIKRETDKKFLVSLGKKANAKLLKKALSLGFENFSIAASSLPETKLLISEFL
jgi:phosphoenolpyruvate-protein kinase (PTS system EI component)